MPLKEVSLLTVPKRKGHTSSHAGPPGEALGSVRRLKEGGEKMAQSLGWFLWEEIGEVE